MNLKKEILCIFIRLRQLKKIVIPSFVVRGNLKHKHVDVETQSSISTSYTTITNHKITTKMTSKTTRTFTKWFLKLEKDTWKNLADRLYLDFETSFKKQYNIPAVDINEIVKSYQKMWDAMN